MKSSKNIFLLTFLMAMIFLIASETNAQGQIDAPVFQNITIPMCHDDGVGNLTSYTVFQTIRLGDNLPCVVKNLLSDGTEFQIPATGTSSEGYCQTPDPTPDCEMMTYCDNGVVFFRIAQIVKSQTATGFNTSVTMIDITETGATYTPSGNEVKGECVLCVEGESVVTTNIETTTGAFAAGGYVSISITNCGCKRGTYTIAGVAPLTYLYPGQTFRYDAYKNPISNEWELNQQINYDAAGTEYCITTTAK